MSQCPRDCINEEHCAKFPCLLGNNQPKHERSRWFRLLAVSLGVVALLTLAGCDSDKRGMKDSPVGHPGGGNVPAMVYNFPDQFANIATKCVGKGWRAFVTTRDAAPAVVEDPTCP